MNVTTTQQALDACSVLIECRGVTYNSLGPNGTITTQTKAFLKKLTHNSGGAPWWSWLKVAPVDPPAAIVHGGGLTAALRSRSLTVQWLNHTSSPTSVSNYSWVPALTPASALPLVQHLGDITLRVRPCAILAAINILAFAATRRLAVLGECVGAVLCRCNAVAAACGGACGARRHAASRRDGRRWRRETSGWCERYGTSAR